MSWHGWEPPTLRHVLGHNRPTRCPQCRRPVAPDMVMATGAWPEALRARLRKPAAPWACDACRATLVREGHVSRADLARHLGAPEAVLQRLATRKGGAA